MGIPAARDEIRLSELVALLSLGIDLGFGQPMEHVIRQTLIALRMGDLLGLTERDRVVVYYSGLLAWVGCHTDAYETAKWFGDDIATRRDAAFRFDMGKSTTLLPFAREYLGGAGRPVFARMRVALAFLSEGWRDMAAMAENHYRATDQLAEQLGLGDDVRGSLMETFERWDGKGLLHRRGQESQLTSRLVSLADVVEVFHREGGVTAAVKVARERSGTQFDPELVALFQEQSAAILEAAEDGAGWDAVVAAEPALARTVEGETFNAALEAIADFADLKSPWTIGHSRAVADLAAAAAGELRLPKVEVTALRRAGLLHDIGRLGVSNTVWDKAGPLSHAEIERVRFHPYITERMLSYSPALEPLAAMAVQHHERLDGSGYPRRLSGAAITLPGRILGVADTYRAKLEPRPHRRALEPREAAAFVQAEVAAGRLDGDAAAAVLRVAGHESAKRQTWPAGLTAREVEVLRLLVRGFTNQQIADQLIISRKTAGNHVEHIYEKTGATNRQRAALFAIKHGLMLDA